MILCPSALSAAPTPFAVSGRRLLRAGLPFTVQGVNYSPAPVGSTVGNPGGGCSGPYLWWTDRPAYIADFPLIRQMGANTIRTFNLMNSNATTPQVLQALNEAQANGLYVIMGYSMPTFQTFAASSSTVQSEVLAAVAAYKDHPAVLLWMLGNEVNLSQPEGLDPAWSGRVWYNFLEQLAAQIKGIDPFHPVGTAEGEIPNVWDFNIGNSAVQADDAHMANLDLWGMNAYRGKTFEGLIQRFAVSTATVKPIFVSEFGKDAWHDAVNAEDPDMQAGYIGSQWQEINANLSAAGAGSADLVGGAVFEWTDEWWKDTHDDCFTHGTQVVFTRSDDSLDPNYQNEWFGVAAVAPLDAVTNPAGTNRSLRKSYFTLQGFWNPAAPPAAAGPGSFFSDTVRNFPNPFRVGGAPTRFVAFVNEAGTIDIRLYDASGQFVTSLPPVAATGAGRYEALWDGKNRQGEHVSPGLYVARIEGHGAAHQDKQFRRVVAVK